MVDQLLSCELVVLWFCDSRVGVWVPMIVYCDCKLQEQRNMLAHYTFASIKMIIIHCRLIAQKVWNTLIHLSIIFLILLQKSCH